MYMKKELFLILDIAMLNKNLIQISKKSLERNVARHLYKSPIPITTEDVA